MKFMVVRNSAARKKFVAVRRCCRAATVIGSIPGLVTTCCARLEIDIVPPAGAVCSAGSVVAATHNAQCHGEPSPRLRLSVPTRASMKPWHNAMENAFALPCDMTEPISNFNEAVAQRHGKPPENPAQRLGEGQLQ